MNLNKAQYHPKYEYNQFPVPLAKTVFNQKMCETLSNLQKMDKKKHWLQADLSIITPSTFSKLLLIVVSLLFKLLLPSYKKNALEFFFGINPRKSSLVLMKMGKDLPDQYKISTVYGAALIHFGKLFPNHKIQWDVEVLKLKSNYQHAWANNCLGAHYLKMNQNGKAIDYFLMAKIQGHIEAEYNLGITYCNIGEGERAIPLFKKAAENNFASAQFNLGTLYYEKKDFEKAGMWWKKSYDNKHPKALLRLEKLQRKLKETESKEIDYNANRNNLFSQ